MAEVLTQQSHKPKRAADDYINFRKKITEKNQLAVIKKLCEEWCLSDIDVCKRLLAEGISREKSRLRL